MDFGVFIGVLPHLLTLIMIGITLLICVNTIPWLKKVNFSCRALTHVVSCVILFQLATIVVYTVGQIEWLANGHLHQSAFASSIGVLAHDYLNGLFHLTVAVSVNGFLRASYTESRRVRRSKNSCRDLRRLTTPPKMDDIVCEPLNDVSYRRNSTRAIRG